MDYSKPLEVRWLCGSCHRKAHADFDSKSAPGASGPTPDASPAPAAVAPPFIVRRLEVWPLDRLLEFEHNPREHSDEQVEAIARSIREFGFTDPPIVDEKRRRILAGNGRFRAALRAGLTEIPVVPIGHLSREQQLAFVIANNRLAELASWDRLFLAEHGLELQRQGYDVTQTGFSEDEINAMIAEAEIPALPETEPPVPAKPESPVTRRGDVWALGSHRVACGDATAIDDLLGLLDGALVDAVWTDPPYNVDYESDAGKIKNDALSPEAFAELLSTALVACFVVLHEGAPIYVAHSDTGGDTFRRAFIDAGFKLASCLIWRKNALVLSRGDYHWQHEPILYGWKPGAAHRWYGARDKTTILEFDEPPFQQIGDDEWQLTLGETTLIVRGQALTVEPARGTVFFEDKPSSSPDHPTMKPVALIERMLKNSARPSNVVLDPFAGSGSTLIACERLGLKGRMLDLDERYVDVAVKRWQNLTGRQATLVGTGETFDRLSGHRAPGA
jgi:DNA modification methylase